VHRLTLLGFALVGFACSPAGPVQSEWSPSPPPEGKAADPTTSPADPATLAQMHALLGSTETLRELASRGESDALRAEAKAFAASLRPSDTVPEGWRDPLDLVHAEAVVLSEHTDDATAAKALARIAQTCGDCHQSAGAQDSVSHALDRGPSPDVGETEAEAMLIHRWSTGQMWDSLVAPDGDRWIEGTTMFVMLPSCAERGTSADQAQRCKQARAIARKAHVVTDARGRTALMGELLSTCAPCHRAAQQSP